jgi:hypothetical protein
MKTYDKGILLEKWSKAYQLLIEQEHNPDDLKLNRAGNPYDHDKFLLMCLVLEKLEDQLRELGVTEKDYAKQRGVEVFTSSLDIHKEKV